MKLLIRHALMLGIALGAGLQAQELRTIKLRTLCFQHSGDIREVLHVSGGEKQELTPVKLLTTMITPEIDARISGGAIRFAVNGSGPDNPASLREVAVAKALPGNRQLAIFVPGDGKGLPYRVFMVDDSLDAFPMGSTLGINLSPAAFEFRIGEHIKALAPGKTAVIPPARKVNDRGQVSVIISVARAESGWRPVSQTRWLAGDDKRDVAIAFLHPKSGQAMVNCYQDNPPWLERR